MPREGDLVTEGEAQRTAHNDSYKPFFLLSYMCSSMRRHLLQDEPCCKRLVGVGITWLPRDLENVADHAASPLVHSRSLKMITYDGNASLRHNHLATDSDKKLRMMRPLQPRNNGGK